MIPAIPLKYRNFLPALVGVLALAGVYRFITLKTLENDRSALGTEVATSLGQAAKEKFEYWVKTRSETIGPVARQLAQATGEDRFFQVAPMSIQQEVIAMTLLRPQEDGTYTIKRVVNRPLTEKHEISDAALQHLEQAAPITQRHVSGDRSLKMINRSVATEEGTLGVISFVLFPRDLTVDPDGTADKAVMVVDFLAEKNPLVTSSNTLGETFLVSADKTLLLHSNLETLAAYRAKSFKDLKETDGWFIQSSTTLLPGTALVARVPRSAFIGPMVPLRAQTWLAAFAVLGISLLLSLRFSSRQLHRLEQVAAALENLERGSHASLTPTGGKEDRAIATVFNRVASNWEIQSHRRLEEGRKETWQSMVEALRTTLKTPESIAFGDWETTVQHSPLHSPIQEFWDYTEKDGKCQVILGHANLEGPHGLLVAAFLRSAIETCRAIDSKTPATMEMVFESINRSLFTLYSGRVVVNAIGLEVELSSGALKWIHAGHTESLRWVTQMGRNEKGQGLKGDGAPLGQQSDSVYTANSTFLERGEALLICSQPGQSESSDCRTDIAQTVESSTCGSLAELRNEIVSKLKDSAPTGGLAMICIRRPKQNAEVQPTALAA